MNASGLYGSSHTQYLRRGMRLSEALHCLYTTLFPGVIGNDSESRNCTRWERALTQALGQV